jgi:hypothetical protein
MIYTKPTKRGLGIEIWGTYDDLYNLYWTLSQFWNQENYLKKAGFESRDTLLSSFFYEIRKAHDGHRLKQGHSHFSLKPNVHYGATISVVHFLFSLAALRYNTRYFHADKYALSVFMKLEFWLVDSLEKLDALTASKLQIYIEGTLDGGNEHIYQYMRSINFEFFLKGGGVRQFRKLPDLMRRSVAVTREYDDYKRFLESEAKRLDCEVNEIEIDDDSFDYDAIKW